jgi:hypothetical protein
MLLEYSENNTKEFLDEFLKRFSSFLETVPSLFSFSLKGTKVIVLEVYSKEEFEWDLNFSISVKDNIKTIKEKFISGFFPVLVQILIDEESYSAKELLDMIDDGIITENQITSIKKKKERKEEWIIEKVFFSKSTLLVKHKSSSKSYICKMKFPITTFLRYLREGTIGTEKEVWDFFWRKSQIEKELEN